MELAPNPHLCIATPNGYFLPLETFIRAQIEGLQPGLTLVGGHYPMWGLDGQSRFPAWLSSQYPRGLLRRGLPPLFRALYGQQLRKLWQQHGTQVLLCQYGVMAAYLAPIAKAAGIPLVVHFHGYDASIHRVLHQNRAGYQAAFQYARAIVAVSEPMAAKLRQLGAPAHKVHNIPYGVDLARFQGADPAQAAQRLLFVGRLVPKKAPLLLLTAFAHVRQTHPAAQLDIVGQGEMQTQVDALIQRLKLTDAVTLCGQQPPARVAELMRQARLYVQHSITAPDGDSEGTPNSILEAAATGLPVVSTQHAGIPEAVRHGETGFVVPEGDVEGMARYIRQLLDDAPLAAQLGAAGRLHMQMNYDRVQQLAKLAALVQP